MNFELSRSKRFSVSYSEKSGLFLYANRPLYLYQYSHHYQYDSPRFCTRFICQSFVKYENRKSDCNYFCFNLNWIKTSRSGYHDKVSILCICFLLIGLWSARSVKCDIHERYARTLYCNYFHYCSFRFVFNGGIWRIPM